MSEKLTKSDVLLICRKLIDKAYEENRYEQIEGITTVQKDMNARIDRGQTAEQALLNILYSSLKKIVPDNPRLNGIIDSLGELVEYYNRGQEN